MPSPVPARLMTEQEIRDIAKSEVVSHVDKLATKIDIVLSRLEALEKAAAEVAAEEAMIEKLKAQGWRGPQAPAAGEALLVLAKAVTPFVGVIVAILASALGLSSMVRDPGVALPPPALLLPRDEARPQPQPTPLE